MKNCIASQGASLPKSPPLASPQVGLSSVQMPEFRGPSKFRKAALFWQKFGLSVIPVVPGSKKPAVSWGTWHKDLSRASINRHWLKHPDHEVGCILGNELVVFDADSATAVSVLEKMEAQHCVEPLFVTNTRRGAHHFYRKDANAVGRTACKVVGGVEDRIDIKTGSTMIILSPSTGKHIAKFGNGQLEHVRELSEAPLSFIEAFVPNFVRVEQPLSAGIAPDAKPVTSGTLKLINVILGFLDADMPRPNWFRAAAAIYYTTKGDPAGYALFDTWSSRGKKYHGKCETGGIWSYFKPDYSRPAGMGTLICLVREAGHTWEEVIDLVDSFDVIEGGGV